MDAAGWSLERLGQAGEPYRFEVSRDAIVAFAKATNEQHPVLLAGLMAPPVFAVVGAVPGAIAPQIFGVAPPELRPRAVHGAHDLRCHRPIRAGMTLVTRAAAVGVRGVTNGVVVVAEGTTETERGELVAVQYVSVFLRGARLDVDLGEAPPDHRLPAELLESEPVARISQRVDEDQAVRYAPASGDFNPIHLDERAARSAGLPGTILHGLCTMAFCARAVTEHFCPENPERIMRLALRFARPVLPGQTLSHSIWRTGADTVAFQTSTDFGEVVIRDGLAAFAA
jgi:acyl dehydratase